MNMTKKFQIFVSARRSKPKCASAHEASGNDAMAKIWNFVEQ